ncbi:MAG: helix-turn-helix domain-containing protein [Firmicutes bacterium]|nr:helix-turn-helix domain-containing protein [Bacillota bacterium]
MRKMMGLGTLLEKARIEQGLTIDELSKRTKIRPQFLRAIEEEEYHLLPGEAYVKPFIRSYAKALGVEEQVEMEFEESTSLSNELTASIRERRERARKTRRKRFVWRLVFSVVLLAGVGYLVYWWFMNA